MISLPLFVADQATKYMVVQKFEPPGRYASGEIDEIPVIDGFFYLHRVHNKGVAFGMFIDGQNTNLIFGLVAAGALGLIFFLYKRDAFPTATGRVAVALLVPGILGNLSDRIIYGYVVDFLSFDLHFRLPGAATTRFASFNIADSCICIAAVLIFISAWQTPPGDESESASDAKANAKS